LNAHLERFFGSLKSECLSTIIFFGESMLRGTVSDYLDHCHKERNHQSLGNTIIVPRDEAGSSTGEIKCRERLGALLRYYRRAAT